MRTKSAVAALTVLGAALRFGTLDRQSFWLDELVTVRLLRRGLRPRGRGERAYQYEGSGHPRLVHRTLPILSHCRHARCRDIEIITQSE